MALTDGVVGQTQGRHTVREVGSVSLVAVGDLLMHGMVQRSARDAAAADEAGNDLNNGGYDVLFEAVTPRVAAADIAFANLETPIAPSTGHGVRPMVFNTPPVLLSSLDQVGFDIVSFANNHVFDQGIAGLVETVDLLGASPIEHVGAGRTCPDARAPVLMEHHDITIAFLGTSDLYNDYLNARETDPCAFDFDVDRILDQAAAARAAGADAIVLSVHWGVEYVTTPEAEHVAAAHALIEGGVDVILGHHAHVLQPIEVLRTEDDRIGVIVYSMGNFISNQSAWYVDGVHSLGSGNPRDGLMVSLTFVRKDYGRVGGEQVMRTELADLVAHPLWTVNNTTTRKGRGPVVIRVIEAADEIARLREAVASETEDDALVRLGRELDHMERRWENVADIVGRHVVVSAPDARAE